VTSVGVDTSPIIIFLSSTTRFVVSIFVVVPLTVKPAVTAKLATVNVLVPGLNSKA
jgi:hypothetical protein